MRGTTTVGRDNFFIGPPAFTPEVQDAEGRLSVDNAKQTDQAQDWRTIINHITDLSREGNSAMEAYGRPGHVATESGLKFMNGWISRVREILPYEYYVDFESEGRTIYKGDEIWVEQLDIRLTRLREIAADIRNRHL